MGWIRKAQRAGRCRSRPAVESLETRNLLSAAPVNVPAVAFGPTPMVAQSSSPGVALSSPNDAITGVTQVRNTYGVNGKGFTAAVIDTGVNYRNAALGGGFGPGAKVIAGYDFADNRPDPMATAMQHGTAVAGLIASDDPTDPGVAPAADIVALRVFDDNNKGSYDEIADALQWVVDNHQKYNITVVNMSITDGNNYTSNVFAQDGGVGQRITGLIDQLDKLNIPVVNAAGNSFDGTSQGMGFTSIIPETISVTATDSSDHLLSDAQRLGNDVGGASATDLAAPGSGMIAPAAGQSTATVQGTSFAAPVVSGSIILLQQIYEARFGQLPTVDQVDSWLKDGADPINDPATGITIGRLDVAKAAGLIPNPQPQQITPPPDPGGTPVPKSAPASTPAPSTPPSSDPAAEAPPTSPPSDSSGNAQAAPTPPAQAAPPPADSGPQTELIVDGQSAGKVPTASPPDPWSHLLSFFSDLGSVSKVQVWTSSPTSTPTSSASPAPTDPSAIPQGTLGDGPGGTVRIRTRSAPSASGHPHAATPRAVGQVGAWHKTWASRFEGAGRTR